MSAGTRGRAHAVVYEVTLDADAAVADAYRAWLEAHVARMLALPGFVSARWFDVAEPAVPGRVGWCVQYRLRDRAALDAYLRTYAPGMRAEGQARFGERVRASRRILHPRPDPAPAEGAITP